MSRLRLNAVHAQSQTLTAHTRCIFEDRRGIESHRGNGWSEVSGRSYGIRIFPAASYAFHHN